MPNTNYILTSDGNFISEEELYHYGVVGMKWGKRKDSYYTAKANSHISKIKTSKTRLGKNYHNYRAYRNEVKSGGKKATDQLLKKTSLSNVSDVYGSGAYARAAKATSDYYKRKSSYTKTRLGTTMAKSRSYNSKTAAAAMQRVHDAKGAANKAKSYINSVANRSVKTWSGRTTTTGKQMVDAILTGGIVGTIKDIKYYTEEHRN